MSDRTQRPVSAYDHELEMRFYAALAERRISRRQLLETAARLGPMANSTPP